MSVYTTLSDHDIRHILSDYLLGNMHGFAGIAAGIENSNFFVDMDTGNRYVLTIFERMDADTLPYFMYLMRHLSEHGFPCPEVQKRKDGSLLFSYQGKQGCIVSCLPGCTLDSLSEIQLFAAGETLARLHLAGKDFTEHGKDPTPLSWMQDTADHIQTDMMVHDDAETTHLLTDELAWQHGHHPTEHMPSGVIHADYFCDNILFSDDQVSGVIDFYYASDGFFAYDLAIAANALACRLQDDDIHRIHILLDGYNSIRPLTGDEQHAFPGLLRLAALRFWISRLHDVFNPREGAMTQTKNPEEYQKKLLLHRKMTLL